MYYICSKTNGVDQLPGYHAADLHICFQIFKQQIRLNFQAIIRPQGGSSRHSMLPLLSRDSLFDPLPHYKPNSTLLMHNLDFKTAT